MSLIRNIENSDLNSIVSVIRETQGIDLGEYAPSSLSRRFLRFMEIKKIWEVKELVEKTRSNKDFADNFLQEITVCVTEMFRDPDFWIILRDKIIPKLQKKESVKIWHAACSTGEEVLSMAILLKEAGIYDKVKITATDINETVLEIARNGEYLKSKQQASFRNHQKYCGKLPLSDYYENHDNKVLFDKDLLKNVDFRFHNLAKDRPLGQFDLIICRNVLIYFNTTLQDKVLYTLNDSLNYEAYLGIGSKESITSSKYSRYFNAISLEKKIFQKRS